LFEIDAQRLNELVTQDSRDTVQPLEPSLDNMLSAMKRIKESHNYPNFATVVLITTMDFDESFAV
jgi:hypothetical protein